MNTREQFGNYLLLKKLGEDPLGESFRAGRVGNQGMESVVLLRVFNGTGLDATTFWNEVSDRAPVQKALQSPNLGSALDLGQVRNVPFSAYDYVSGKNLAELLAQAAIRKNPIPADHALLIAERTALGLAVAYETKFGGERLVHGALVPQLLMISNEGETKLLGLDVGPGLRKVIQSGAAPQLAHYLSPEARAGKPASRSDDVYSLGVLLLELLTGEAVADGAAAAALIDRAKFEPEGSPLPAPLKTLIMNSMAPDGQRIADAPSWHKALSKMMFEGQFSPTTFNLAFYMHNLFREEIEKETQEIEVEKTMEIPIPATVPPPAATPAASAATAPAPSGAQPAVREVTGVDTGVIRDQYGIEDDKKKSSSKSLMIGVAAAVIVIGGGIAAMMMTRGGDEPAGTTEVADAAAEPALPPVTPPPIEEPIVEVEEVDPEEEARKAEEERARLEAQIAELVTAQTEKYDQELQELRSQLDSAKERAAEAEAEAAQAAAEQAVEDTEPEPTELAEGAPAAVPAEPGGGDANQDGEAMSTEEIASAEPAAAEPPPVAEEPEPLPPPEPVVEKVKRGELVTFGPGVSAPKLTKMRPLTYPPVAMRMRKEATVVVRVLVDENGKVLDTKLKGDKVGFGLDEEAMSAARSARFNPAKKNGVPVKIWWELPIQFKL